MVQAGNVSITLHVRQQIVVEINDFRRMWARDIGSGVRHSFNTLSTILHCSRSERPSAGVPLTTLSRSVNIDIHIKIATNLTYDCFAFLSSCFRMGRNASTQWNDGRRTLVKELVTHAGHRPKHQASVFRLKTVRFHWTETAANRLW